MTLFSYAKRRSLHLANRQCESRLSGVGSLVPVQVWVRVRVRAAHLQAGLFEVLEGQVLVATALVKAQLQHHHQDWHVLAKC
jgi:hypothetical protein